jgi:hypothetical protein
MMGFGQRAGFTADAGSQNAPRVDFGGDRQPSVNFDSTR